MSSILCVYMLNRSYRKSLQGKTPHEKWSQKKPKMGHLRIFGLIIHVKTNGKLRKLDTSSIEILFLGYERDTKAYQCF